MIYVFDNIGYKHWLPTEYNGVKRLSNHDFGAAVFEDSEGAIKLLKYYEGKKLYREDFQLNFPYRNNLSKKISGVYPDAKWMNVRDCLANGVTHSLAHFHSGVIDTDEFYNSNWLGISLDGNDPIDSYKGVHESPYNAFYYEKGILKKVIPMHSPAYLWDLCRFIFGKKEGTLMSLCSACRSTISVDTFLSVFSTSMPGSWYSAGRYLELSQWTGKFVDQWRRFYEVGKWDLIDYDKRFTKDENLHSAIMKHILSISTDLVERQLQSIIEDNNIDCSNTVLSITGGYALNVISNSYLMKRFGFKRFISSPVVDDSGMSLGMGLHYFMHRYGTIDFHLGHASYGSLDNDDVGGTNFDIDTFIRDVEEFPVLWFFGKSEIGPRALMNRSIISSATSLTSKNNINQIKKRAWWHPVAPIILKDRMFDWLDIDDETDIDSRFMLRLFPIRNDKLETLKAVAHLDNTTRVQTIDTRDDFYPYLQKYYEKTGVPILCNTSMNDKGEPIIQTKKRAIEFAKQKGIKVGYFEGKRVVIE